MTMTTDPVVRLDVRPVLAAGEEPLALILQTADRVPPGGVLEVTAPFEPVPLYAVLAQRGFAHHADAREDGWWVVRFTRAG
jgi:uncharacterized protein (DUF2249 family)